MTRMFDITVEEDAYDFEFVNTTTKNLRYKTKKGIKTIPLNVPTLDTYSIGNKCRDLLTGNCFVLIEKV
jgi:hypothetical protein